MRVFPLSFGFSSHGLFNSSTLAPLQDKEHEYILTSWLLPHFRESRVYSDSS